MMKLTIRKKVLFCSLIPLLLLGGIILLIASTIVKGAIIIIAVLMDVKSKGRKEG